MSDLKKQEHITIGVPAQVKKYLMDRFAMGAFPNWKLGNAISAEEARESERIVGLIEVDDECSAEDLAKIEKILEGTETSKPIAGSNRPLPLDL